MNLDYPEKRIAMQIETMKDAVYTLKGQQMDIIGRSKTLPFNPLTNLDEDFHTDCFRKGSVKYALLLDKHNPDRDIHRGIMEIRSEILARLVYGCLRSEDIDDTVSTVGELAMNLFTLAKKLRIRERQSPEERFNEAVSRYDGKGFEMDKGYAVSMLLDLVDMGYPPALNYIGAMYMNGEYFEKDEKKGFEMINTAAGMGFPKSMMNLSRMYRDGDYVKKNVKRADEYENRAIEMRYLPAIIAHEMRTGEISSDSVKALIGFAIDHGAMRL